MKVIIAGSRHFCHAADYTLVEDAVRESGFEIEIVVSGMAKGIDTHAITYAKRHSLPVAEFYANWQYQGHFAGRIRNKRMADHGDALIAVWDGVTTGTKDMIAKMRFLGKPVYVKDAGL